MKLTPPAEFRITNFVKVSLSVKTSQEVDSLPPLFLLLFFCHVIPLETRIHFRVLGDVFIIFSIAVKLTTGIQKEIFKLKFTFLAKDSFVALLNEVWVYNL